MFVPDTPMGSFLKPRVRVPDTPLDDQYRETYPQLVRFRNEEKQASVPDTPMKFH